MVQLTHPFALLFCLVSLAVDTSSVGAVPLPVQQRTFKVQSRAQGSREAFQGYHRATPQQAVTSFPVATAVRGSSSASRQAAEAKRSLREAATGSPTLDCAGKQAPGPASASVLSVSQVEEPSMGWIVNGHNSDAVRLTQTSDDVTDSTVHSDMGNRVEQSGGLQYNAAEPTGPSSQTAVAPSQLQEQDDGGDETLEANDPPLFDDGLYHPLSRQPQRQQGSQPLAPPAGFFFRASQGDPTLQAETEADLYRRSIYHDHHGHRHDQKAGRGRERTKDAGTEKAKTGKAVHKHRPHDEAKESGGSKKESRSLVITGDGIDIRLQGEEAEYIQSSSKTTSGESLIELSVRRLHDHEHIHSHDRDRGDDEHSHRHEHVHEHIHRRLVEPLTSAPVIGQLGILQPLSGSLGNNGMSQLVANLVLAPMAQATGPGSRLFTSSFASADGGGAPLTNGTDSSLTQADNDGAFLLAPSTSSDGIKLQMVDASQIKSEPNESNWKHVEFQATLTNARNEPHLYCAVVRPPSNLRMELCDSEGHGNVTEEARQGASRMFLYDSSTGEVVPYKPSGHSEATTIERREAIGAAKLSMEPGQPQTVKLVFFTDQAKGKNQGNGDEDEPPLLASSDPSPFEPSSSAP